MKSKYIVAWLAVLLGLANVHVLSAQTISDKSKSETDATSSTKTKDGSPEKDDVLQLSTFTVEASANDGGYGALRGTAGRVATAYIDTPQAVSVITSELLDDAKLFNSNTALLYTPSVKNASQVIGTTLIRGNQTNSTFTDGFAGGTWASFDTAFVDRIEVVKGPSSNSFGRGDPAGFINYVSKRALFKQGTEIGAIIGTGNRDQNFYRATLDNNGFLSDGHQAAYRFVSYYQDGAESRDHSENQSRGAQLSIGYNLPKNKGKLDIIGSYSITSNPGIVNRSDMSNAAARKQFRFYFTEVVGSAPPDFPLIDGNEVHAVDQAGYLQTEAKLSATLDYRLGEHWQTRQSASISNYKSDGSISDSWQSFSVYRAPDGTLMHNVTLYSYFRDETRRTWQSDFLGKYDIEKIGGSFSLLTGGDITTGPIYDAVFATSTKTISMPLYAPTPHVPMGPFLQNPEEVGVYTTGNFWSAYAQGQLTLWHDRIQLTAAGRKNYQDTETLSRRSGGITPAKSKSPVLPTYSLLVKPREWLSFYVTASKYITPASVGLRYGQLPDTIPQDDPRRSETIIVQPRTEQIEVGAKATLFDGKLTLSIDHYKTKSPGTVITVFVPYNAAPGVFPFYSVLNPTLTDNEGWEIEGFGKAFGHLTYMFGATLGNKGHQQGVWKQTEFFTGRRDIGNTAYGYLTYDFGKSRYNGLSITGGWKTMFHGWTMDTNMPPDLQRVYATYPKDEHVVDLGISYGFRDKYEIFLKGNNIFHRTPVYTFDQGVVYGRQVFLGVNVKL